MRFIGIVFGFFLLSNAYGGSSPHIHRPYDLDSDGHNEILVLNSNGFSAIWIELDSTENHDTLWSYSLSNGGTFSDGEIVDINNDGFLDLILIPNLNATIGEQVWFYLFLGEKNFFLNTPFTIEESLLGLTTIRPSNLSLIPGENPKLAVSFGSPVRQGMIFDISIENNSASIINPQLLSAPLISNGYGAVYIGGFKSNGGHYIALLSPQGNQLNIAIFDIADSFSLLKSETININDARYLLGSQVQPAYSKTEFEGGLLVPFGSDDTFLLSVVEGDAILSNTNLSGLGAFSQNEKQSIMAILDLRESAEILEKELLVSTFSEAKPELPSLTPPAAVLPDESATLNTVLFDYEKDVTFPSEVKRTEYENSTKAKEKRDYSSLAPTLSDFLETIQDDTESSDDKNQDSVSVPIMNEDMMSVNWADEAGFTQLELGEYIPETLDSLISSPVPERDSGIVTFTRQLIDSLKIKRSPDDSIEVHNASNGIELYYVLAMTPVSENKDRYVFDGEPPFGVAVNQVPPIGKATHLQHGISADLSVLEEGEAYDFAYSLRDARLDSITTLTMVHDMHTNVVFMSISPTEDSVSQSYQSESFDPKLFEFPDYFFEGFPNSLNMDFTDKLIRFSFKGDEDSTYQGIYLSSTTPSDPSQSLAVFMDQGTLQSIRGEIVVRPNGSKKITTEYDLVGTTEPSVMFSRLIQEMFPEELKIKLLQDAYLEQPLFGPGGKLPKVSREPRLPEVQSSQVETEIPIEPKQSNIPETVIDSVMIISDSSVVNPETQKNELLPSLLEPKKVAPADSSQGDSLKLETKKIIKDSAEQDAIPKTEESQLDQESLETNLKKEGDSAKTDSTQSKNSESGNQGTDKQLDITTEKASNDSTSSTDNN